MNYRPVPSENSVENPNSKDWSVDTIYQYEHFKSMAGLKPVYWINDKNDYKKIVSVLKGKYPSNAQDQLVWRDMIIGKAVYKTASKHIVNQLLRMN